MSRGVVSTTGRPLDVAMRGNAWLAVQALDGTEAYTRAGSLEVSADGTLLTHGGLQVMGDGGPIQLPANSEPSIAPDGTVSARGANGRSTAVGRLKLVTPEAPLNRGDRRPVPRRRRRPAGRRHRARLQDGALEGSNVSPVETMVAMISAARQFEAQMKVLQTAEGNEQAAAQLLSVS